jgi:tetratricopeptide (TPR) repeat protein
MKPILLILTLSLLLAGCGKASRLDRHLSRADKAYAAGDYDTARIEYLNAFRIDGNHPHVVSQLALIYHDTGSMRQAAPFLGRARELAPDNVDVQFRLALLYIAGGDRDRALTEIDAILERQPAHPEAPLLFTDIARTPEHIDDARQRLLALRSTTGETATLLTAQAMLRLREQQTADAEAIAQKAVALDSQFAPAHIALAVVEITRTNLDAADRHFQTATELSPIRSEHQIRYLQFKRDRGQIDEARSRAEALIAKAPDYLPAGQFMAQLLFDQREFDAARKQLERVLARDPAHYEANLLHARLRLAQNEPTQAVEEFERLATIYPNSPELRHQLALASLVNRDLTKAHANASQAVQLNPNAPDAVLLLGTLDIARGDFDAAIAGLTGLLTQQPGNSRVALALAQAYRGRGRLEDALAIYEAHFAAVPTDPQGPYNAGLVLRQLNRFDQARARFEAVLELNPSSPAAIRQLVELDLQTDQSDRALSRAQAFTEAQPESAAARLLLAQVHLSRQNPESAETELKQALEFQPDLREAQVLLARVYVSLNRQDQALDELRALVQRNTNDTGALVLIGTIHSEANQYDQAIAAYEQALAVNPNFVVALNNLAYLYAEQPGRMDRAYELARRARTLQPNDPAIADTLGWVHFQRAEYTEALPLLLESVARLPDVAELQYHVGATHYMLGQETPARTALQAALQSTDPFKGRADAEHRLRILDLDLDQSDPSPIAVLEATLAEQPRDLFAWLRLGALHERAGNVDPAIRAYAKATEISPRALAPQLSLAQLYASRPQDRAQALTLAKRARDLAPTDPIVAMTLGHLVFQAGDHAWALSLLTEATQRIGNNPELLYDLAWAQYSVGRIDEAQRTMRQALEINPSFAHADAARRFVEIVPLGADPDIARANGGRIQQALDAEPNHAPALMAVALVRQAENDPVSARQAAELVLVQFPSFAPADRLLALLYTSNPPDYEKARRHGLKARDRYPTDPAVAKALGIASYHQNAAQNAVDLLTEAARARGDDPEILVHLGLAQHQLKRHDEARPNLERALELSPNITLAAEVKQALSEPSGRDALPRVP